MSPQPGVMLVLAVLASFLGVAVSQKTFYCNSPGINAIADRDFYFVIHPSSMNCNFTAETDSISQFFIETVESQFSRARFVIKSKGVVLLSDTYVPRAASNILTKTGSMQVQFEAFGSADSETARIRLRVRAVTKTACPPGWLKLNGTCYGTNVRSGPLVYNSAQQACNRMRANLLHVPANFTGGIGNLLRQLPPALTSNYSWIGFTNIENRASYVWLNGDAYFEIFNLRCMNANGYCGLDERCAAAVYPSSFAAHMTSCYKEMSYICYMPPGGADTFFSVPNDDKLRFVSTPPNALLDLKGDWLQWVMVAIGCLFGVGILVCLCYTCFCKKSSGVKVTPERPRTTTPESSGVKVTPVRPRTPTPEPARVVGAVVYFQLPNGKLERRIVVP